MNLGRRYGTSDVREGGLKDTLKHPNVVVTLGGLVSGRRVSYVKGVNVDSRF